jgi:hypothetical protein
MQRVDDSDLDSEYASTEDYLSPAVEEQHPVAVEPVDVDETPKRNAASWLWDDLDEDEDEEEDEYQPEEEDEEEEEDRLRVDAVQNPDSAQCVADTLQVVGRKKNNQGFIYKVAVNQTEHFWVAVNEADDTLRVLLRQYDNLAHSLCGNAQVLGKRKMMHNVEYKVVYEMGTEKWVKYEHANPFLKRLIRMYQLQAQGILTQQIETSKSFAALKPSELLSFQIYMDLLRAKI